MRTTIATLLIIFFAGCSKDNPTPIEDKLPEATTTGTNTAGCYINGQLLIPKNGINSTSGYPVYGLITGAGVNFNAPIIGDDYWYVNIANLRSVGKDYWIYIHINNMTMGTGNYNIGQSNLEFYADAPNNVAADVIAKVKGNKEKV